jgi:two-component system chemotaxis response regulator CheB
MDIGRTEAADGGLWVVGLVASTGGLDALGQVLAPLPAGFPAAMVALQHIRPEHPSRLAEILARRTALRVQPARDGDRLRPGLVLVAPPGRHTLVCPDRTIALIDSGQLPPSRPSADLLLTSMALSCRERAVAVVLSGTGHDGTAGAAAVKRMGGLVLAQDQATSREFGMPGSAIAFDEIVDRVLALARIGPALREMVSA